MSLFGFMWPAIFTMRLHGVHAFDAFPMVVRCGGMLQSLGPRAGRKVVHPETGDTTILCEGFNQKNHYDRETPCDPDFLRKVAKDTDAQALMRWFGGEGCGCFSGDGLLTEKVFLSEMFPTSLFRTTPAMRVPSSFCLTNTTIPFLKSNTAR